MGAFAGYKKRLIEKHLDLYLNKFGAVCIEGPKYCGKTWTAMSRANSSIFIGDPKNNFQNRTMAQLDPSLVLEGDAPRLIDEWQEVRNIWDAVRYSVDQKGSKGQYILTGSATVNREGILHSGVGRIANIQMDTMSLYETGDSDAKVSLIGLFNEGIKAVKTKEVSLKMLVDLCVRGGWPGGLEDYEGIMAKEYLNTLIKDDIDRVEGVSRDKTKFRSLLRSLARNESTLVKNAKLKSDMEAYDEISIDSDTVASYLNVLRKLFLIYEQEAFSPSIRSKGRLLSSPKKHFIDPSLAVAALDITGDMLMNDLNTFGYIFEALCEHDLKIYAAYNDAKLYHMRTVNNKEIDAIVELKDGTWAAFEIKLGANQIESASKELLNMKKMLSKEGVKEPKFLCVICGLSNMAYQREDGVYVVPITSLRP